MAASRSKVVTELLETTFPVLRLRLTKPAQPIVDSSETITGSKQENKIEQIEGSFPVLRLRLTKRAEEIGSVRPRDQEKFLQVLKQDTRNMFVKSDSMEAIFDKKASPKETSRNIEKLRANFQEIKDKISEQEERVTLELENMSLAQQEQVLIFWEAATSFFLDIVEFVREMFRIVVEKILQGFSLAKDVVAGIFKEITDLLELVFSQQKFEFSSATTAEI